MTDLLRQEVTTAAHTVIVKVGTRVLTGTDGRLNQDRVVALAEELHQIASSGRKVALVTSRSGRGRHWASSSWPSGRSIWPNCKPWPRSDNRHLIEAYDRGLRKHGQHAAQLLLTAEDLDDRTRYLNVRNTLLALFEFGAIPIINENDTVSVEELKTTFGDNDRLAAMVTNLIRAPLLMLLSDVDGLFDGDPADPASRVVSNRFATRCVDHRTGSRPRHRAEQRRNGQQDRSRAAGHLGRRKRDYCQRPHAGILVKILAGENVGTLFLGTGSVDPLLEALDRLHGPAARTLDRQRRRPPGDRRRKDAACWPSASPGPPANFRRATSWRWPMRPAASLPAA